MEITQGYSEYDEVWFTESTDSMTRYVQNLLNDVEMALKPLLTHISEISIIESYSDLLLVDQELLRLLEAFEMARVELNEGNAEGILSMTGGHHKDYLNIYQDALARRCSPRTDYICLNDERFDVTPYEIVMNYISNQLIYR